MPRPRRQRVPAILLSDEEFPAPSSSRSKAQNVKIATDGEMEFAMHQVLFNLNVSNANYYSLAFEGDRRWTFMGSGIEYIEVCLSRCRTRLIINMIGPIQTSVVCLPDVNKTVLEIARDGFMDLLLRVVKIRFPEKK